MENRGTKRFADDPNAPLMTPTTSVKMKKNKSEKSLDSKVHTYNLFAYDEFDDLAEIGEIIAKRGSAVSVSSVRGYIIGQYKTEDAALLRDRLGLTNDDIERAYLTMEAIKVQQERDGVEACDNVEYAERFQESLGPDCVNPVLTKGLVGKLYHDLIRCGVKGRDAGST